jgi:hypothetical protein
MKDFYMHERREDNFWEDLGRTMTKLDTAFSPPRRTETTPDRDFVLYLILLIVTMGFFGVYWIYVLLNDPNEHFNYHKCAEKQLLDTLGSIEV